MSFIKLINNIPVYTTIREALRWGGKFGISGAHIHKVNNRPVYMAGKTHAEINKALERVKKNKEERAAQLKAIKNQTQQTSRTQQTTTPTTGQIGSGEGY